MLRVRAFGLLALTALSGLVAGSAAHARIAIPNKAPFQQALEADVVVVGKVGEVEKELVQATQTPGGGAQKVGYQVATLNITEALQGAKGLTTLRVGWMPAPMVPAPGNDVLPGRGRPIPARFTVTLKEGQEGCFFLKKHHEGDFYVLVQWGMPLEKTNPNYSKEIEKIKKMLTVLEKPVESLKASDAADKQFAAAVLLRKYRTYPQTNDGKPAKEEAVPAEENKLILEIMAGMDWNKFDPEGLVSLQSMFYSLGLQQGMNGYAPPKFQPGQKDYAKVIAEYNVKFLKDNADKIQIKRFVVSK